MERGPGRLLLRGKKGRYLSGFVRFSHAGLFCIIFHANDSDESVLLSIKQSGQILSVLLTFRRDSDRICTEGEIQNVLPTVSGIDRDRGRHLSGIS